MIRETEILQIGSGSAAQGTFVKADALGGGVLERVATSVTVITKGKGLDCGALDYKIDANSAGSDFIAGVQGRLRFTLGHPSAQELARLGNTPPRLTTVADYLNHLGPEIERSLPNGSVISGTEVTKLVQERTPRGGLWYTAYADKTPIARARWVISSPGGDEIVPKELSNLREDIIPAGKILKGNADQNLRYGFNGQPGNMLIVGSGHSTWAAVDYTLREFGDKVGERGIWVAHRVGGNGKDKTKVYFDTVAEALGSGLVTLDNLDPSAIDWEKTQYRRFDGLRHRAKNRYLDVVQGRELRVGMIPFNGEFGHLAPAVQAARIVAVSIGYRANSIDILNEHGDLLGPGILSNGNLLVDGEAKVYDTLGRVIPQVFGNGLAHSVREGVNLFHGENAGHILRQIMAGEVPLRKDQLVAGGFTYAG